MTANGKNTIRYVNGVANALKVLFSRTGDDHWTLLVLC